MERVPSNDGTGIAFERVGSGPPVVIVLGALNDRASGAPLARFLSKRFTVLDYDRRGKRASGDSQPYAFGLPDEFVAQLRHAPFRPSLEAMAHTLPCEAEVTATKHDVPSVLGPVLEAFSG